MKTTYNIVTFDADKSKRRNLGIRDVGSTVTTADVALSLWGRDFRLTLHFYQLDSQGTIITFGLKPLGDGMYALPFGTGSTHRWVYQELVVHPMYGEVMGLSELNDSAVFGGRTISQAFRDTFESIFETVRLTMRRNFGREVADRYLADIDKRFGAQTRETIREVLGSLHWALLLHPSECGQQCLSVVQTSLSRNFPRQFGLSHNGNTDIPELPANPMSYSTWSLADVKATALLQTVCGKAYAKFFKIKGYITVKNMGYSFKVAPGKFVECTDPNGKTASLCIHTVNFSCNPIDEVVIAYLHIKNHLAEYMDKAVAHSAQAGFQRSPEIAA